MLEQDYIIRQIKEIIRAVLKLLFHIDTETPTAELLENEEDKAALEMLLAMVDAGNINEAENRIFELADTENEASLKLVLSFFSYLNDKPDDFLTENEFSREELQDDLKHILSRYALGSIAEAFLS